MELSASYQLLKKTTQLKAAAYQKEGKGFYLKDQRQEKTQQLTLKDEKDQATPTKGVVQRKITYNRRTGDFGRNSRRPGWLGLLKGAYAAIKIWWRRNVGGSDVAHILSFDAIQRDVLHACVENDSTVITNQLGRFFSDHDQQREVEQLCHQLDAAVGAAKVPIANRILSRLNSSTQNTRHGYARVNRSIGNRFDPELERRGRGRALSLTPRARLFVDEAIDPDNRGEIRNRRGGTRSVRLRRTDSGDGFYTSDFPQPVPFAAVDSSDEERLLSMNDSDSD